MNNQANQIQVPRAVEFTGKLSAEEQRLEREAEEAQARRLDRIALSRARAAAFRSLSKRRIRAIKAAKFG